MTEPRYPDALPAQQRLHWYVIERVLGQGGFGITYLARDTNLDQPVAIKEYLPVDVATRRPDATIRARTEENRERYRWGLDRFIQEARMLARFDHPNIVRVLSVFELNNTAYMVMRFEAGENLARLLEGRGTLAEDELLRILLPVLDGLALVHAAGFIHRDIKPDNIQIRPDGSPVLLDFGSARSALGKAHTLTILVAPGYAPFEQYYSSSESQGPWTDVYGLGATAYRAIAGRAPLDAIARSKGILGSTRDVMVPASVVGAGRYSGRLLAAIDHALAFSEKERPQSVAAWRRELFGEDEAPAPHPGARVPTHATRPAPPAAPAPATLAAAPMPGDSPGRRGPVTWSIAGAAVAAAAVGLALYFFGRAGTPTDPPAPNPRQEQVEAPKPQPQEPVKPIADEKPRENERPQEMRGDKRADGAATQTKEHPGPAPVPPRPKETKQSPKIEPPPRAGPPRPPPVSPAIAAPKPEPPAAPKAEALPERPASSPAPEPPTPAQQLAAAGRALARGNYADAAELLKPLAERGEPRAQYLLATLLATGQGVARNEQEALQLLARAGGQGIAAAQTALGDAYAQGRGVARDDHAAREWYQKAATQGDGEAQTKLGDMFASGRGVAQNAFQAYVWYGIAARSGSAAAREKQARIAPQLQPAEIRQADQLIESRTRDARPR
jgi:serine/threonine protein kinase